MRQLDGDASARSIIPVNVSLLQSQDNTASGGVAMPLKKTRFKIKTWNSRNTELSVFAVVLCAT